jgi:chemotaxis-related protein WspB
MKMLAVTFRVATAAYAIRCEHIVAVIPQVALRPVAHGSASLKGVFVYRGGLTLVVDLCQLIAGYACPTRLSSRIALVRCQAPDGSLRTVGLLAEHMTEARRVEAQRAASPPVNQAPYFGEVLLEGVEPLQLLNVDAILPSAGPLLAEPGALPKVIAGEKDREPTQP